MIPKNLLPQCAFGAFFLFIAPWLPGALGIEWLFYVFVTLGLTLLGSTVYGVFRAKHEARYSLEELRLLHESGGPPPASDEIPDVPDDAGIMCPCCGNVYAAWIKVCPHCGR